MERRGQGQPGERTAGKQPRKKYQEREGKGKSRRGAGGRQSKQTEKKKSGRQSKQSWKPTRMSQERRKIRKIWTRPQGRRNTERALSRAALDRNGRGEAASVLFCCKIKICYRNITEITERIAFRMLLT